MPEETGGVDERVVERLEDIRNEVEACPLYWLAKGTEDPQNISYEGWVRPLKLTGGRVCLRVDHGFTSAYVTRGSAGDLIYRLGERSVMTVIGPRAVQKLCQSINHGRDITPVPVEATPFAEADDGR